MRRLTEMELLSILKFIRKLKILALQRLATGTREKPELEFFFKLRTY